MPSTISQMHSLRAVASRINSGVDLPGLLFDLVKAACDHGGWSMGSIMAVDAAQGYAHVFVRYDPSLLKRPLEDRWELATSPALIALQTGEPVYIPDARATDAFPGYRREAYERDYHSVLVMPLTSVDADGRPMVLSLISRALKPLPSDDLAFMGMIVHLGAIAVEREYRMLAERRAADEQRRALHAQGGLLEVVLSGGSTEQLAARLQELLYCAVLVVDFGENGLVAAGSPIPLILDEKGWRDLLAAGHADSVVAAVRQAAGRGETKQITLDLNHAGGGLKLTAAIEPLSVDGQTVGALVLLDEERGGDLHKLMLESAKFALSVQMMRSVIQFRFEARTLTELFFEIVERRWRDPADIARRARRLGLPLSRPLRMLVIDFPGAASGERDASLDAHQSVLRLARQHGLSSHVIAIGTGLVCLLPEQAGDNRDRLERFAQRLAESLRHVFNGDPIAVIGGICLGIEDYSGEWERAWRMVRIARSFRRSGVVSALDFGPLPMLIGASDSAEVRAFVDGSIGMVVAHDRAQGTPYLETLAAYLRAGCRSQPCADAMGLHVTTLRYRLARIEELFGINADTPDRRFALELALKMHGVIDGSAIQTPLG
ncbi:helix-turn-helix domain-containing protein [Aquabacter spiritensis]|uniref:GAF domain-containing protein n=1 Tax=Aquabacter spiritensis TaxID=933073 RepID=A0A4R3LVU8_9HYPH|nr:helix-turn-helix domain-containing protein [Aquabacter spiritensis]TCT04780.1 GAF domain-containing protein [Aquabacter spiritensis]